MSKQKIKGKERKQIEIALSTIQTKCTEQEAELEAWEEFCRKATAIIAPLIPVPNTSEMKQRDTLLNMIQSLTEKASHPEKSHEYLRLSQRLDETEEHARRLEQQVNKMTEEFERAQLGQSNTRSVVLERLSRLDSLLADRIQAERKLMESSASPYKSTTSTRRERDALSLLSSNYRDEFANASDV